MSRNREGAAALPSLAAGTPLSGTAPLRGATRSQALLMGRLLGLGMLVAFGLGMYSNFQLQNELFAPPGFLFRAAGMPLHVGALVLIGLVTAAMWSTRCWPRWPWSIH